MMQRPRSGFEEEIGGDGAGDLAEPPNVVRCLVPEVGAVGQDRDSETMNLCRRHVK